MQPDPREANGSFGKLLGYIRQCKAARTCAALRVRSFYFEPNPITTPEWQREGMYCRTIDDRVVFVCESPGPSGKAYTSPTVARCWAITPRDARFRKIRQDRQFDRCYVTNVVKCGVRRGRQHTDAEFRACTPFLMQELELLRPMVVVAVGGNALSAVRRWVLPQLAKPPIPFQITHYSARGDVQKAWTEEFAELERLLSRLKPWSAWKQ
jgi:hypothetical protein